MKKSEDHYLLGIPSRWCDRCESPRLFSQDGRMCLACGTIRDDPFIVKGEDEK